MDDDTKNKLKDVLSTIDPVEFHWDDNMSSTGFSAQPSYDIDLNITTNAAQDTITLNGGSGYDSITFTDLSTITIGGAVGAGSVNTVLGHNGNNSYWSTANINTGLQINQDNGRSYIKTPNHEIDLDELGEMMETLKKRLLILTPSFEMHEKYPMLKELYDEYKALEKLLSGPDNTPEDM